MGIGTLVAERDLLTIRRRLVRDLAWSVLIGPIVRPIAPRAIAPRSIASALAAESSYGEPVPLWSSPERWFGDGLVLESWERFRRHLAHLDDDPSALERWMAGSDRRRHGLRYERFLAYYLEWHPEVELLVHDLAVQGRDRTLGQFDFVYRLAGCIVHLEVAIKYYMRLGRPWETQRCLGTDLVDRLDRKLAHGLARQLRLSNTEEGERVLAAADIPRVDERRFVVRGLLFDPLGRLDGDGADDTVPRYWAATRAELRERSWARSLRWAEASRGEWFSPVTLDEVESCDLEEILDVPLEGLPRLVLGLDDGGEATRGILLDRAYYAS